MNNNLVYRLREKYDSDLDEYDELCQEAAACIEAQDKRNRELEAALRKIEKKYWYPSTAEIARAALGERKDD